MSTTTTAPRHTPGPWRVSEYVATRVDAGEHTICTMSGVGFPDQANARLIAAAPALAEELRGMGAALANWYVVLENQRREGRALTPAEENIRYNILPLLESARALLIAATGDDPGHPAAARGE